VESVYSAVRTESLYTTDKLRLSRVKENLYGLYSSPNVIRVMKSRRMGWAGHATHMGDRRGAYRVLVGRPEGNTPLGRPRRRWDNDIRMDLKETGWLGVAWIELAQDRDRWRTLLDAVMNLRVP
jgi:hypothetical protein